MKSCPSCQATYADESLQFCFEDGSRLLNYRDEGLQMRSETFDETETIVRQAPGQRDWEQSQVTRVATLQPAAKRSNALPAIILLALLALIFFGGAAGLWLLVSVAGLKSSVPSNSNTNIAVRLPSPTPTPKTTPSNKNTTAGVQNQNSLTIVTRSNSNGGRISVGGEGIKACDYLLGSGLYGKWKQMGGENGPLGCPVMNETEAARSPQGTTGRMTQFKKGDGGFLIWHGSGRYSGTAFEVGGCMFKLYSSIGGTRSWLGFPVRDGYFTPTGARQDFEGGYILWDSKTSVCQAYKTR